MANVYPVIGYCDAIAAIEFLTSAFGFAVVMTVPGEEGVIVHAELAHSADVVLIHTRRGESAGAVHSNGISLYLVVDDIDAHFAGAVAAGASITKEPFDTEYGSRDYSALDSEGYVWNFGTYRPASPAPSAG